MKVSIIMLTYNHEKFILDAIEGVLLQETNFPFELIVANDHSTDRTEQLVNDYRKKHPQIIKGYDNKKNLGPRLNFIKAYSQANGEYIATCEGDDYWSDPHKLQAQINFLDDNRDYIISFHDIKVIDEFGELLDDKRQPPENKRDFGKYELSSFYIPTPTIVYRKILKKLPGYFRKSDNGDALLLSLLSSHGAAKYLPDIKESFVRVHPGGIWSSRSYLSRWSSNLNTKYIIFKSLNKALRKQLFNNYVQMYEMAAWDADYYKSKRYWYKYNLRYLQFCLISQSYGKAWLIFRRIINKPFGN